VQSATAGERITLAIQRAHECYLATPEAERVYRFDEAIRFLAQYVAISIAIGAKTVDTDLLASLPELLAPFTGLSPMLEAIWQNAIATCEFHCDCQYERARTRWIEVLHKLDSITGDELQHVDVIRNAIACAVGMTEAGLGLASAANWAAQLDQDPLQKVSATQLRRIVRLEQGDWGGAERLRRHAEVLALQARSPQMFSAIATELSVHAAARDLGGVKDAMARIEPLALRHPGWLAYLLLAEARFQYIRGDFTAAESGFSQCIEMTALNANRKSRGLPVWIAAQAGRSEALLGLERAEDARTCAAAALAMCDELQVDSPAQGLTRALALAEAKLGDFPAASTRLDALIERQQTLGVTGLKLGLSYESRAQVAIWANDVAGFEQYSRLTAREYRYGAGCPLGARYERLLNEARRCGFVPVAELATQESLTSQATNGTSLHDVPTAVLLAMNGAQHTEDRALRALRLVCDVRAAQGGHFYLARSADVVLAASHAVDAPPESLRQQVQQYLTHEADRSETRTVVSTGTAVADIGGHDSVVQVDGVRYELLLVACVVGSMGKVAGVIAVVDGERKIKSLKQDRLLSAIATHLLQAADSGG
jgi:tetratricopeptide (TPR) repeat protein